MITVHSFCWLRNVDVDVDVDVDDLGTGLIWVYPVVIVVVVVSGGVLAIDVWGGRGG